MRNKNEFGVQCMICIQILCTSIIQIVFHIYNKTTPISELTPPLALYCIYHFHFTLLQVNTYDMDDKYSNTSKRVIQRENIWLLNNADLGIIQQKPRSEKGL